MKITHKYHIVAWYVLIYDIHLSQNPDEQEKKDINLNRK